MLSYKLLLPALVPYLDLLNHCSDVEISAGVNEETGTYRIVTHSPVDKYNQVMIDIR